MNDRAYPLVDARCTHPRCDEPNAYRMVGSCTNCGTEPLLLLISAGHEKPLRENCPKCGNYSVRADRLAEDDELPAVPAAAAGPGTDGRLFSCPDCTDRTPHERGSDECAAWGGPGTDGIDQA